MKKILLLVIIFIMTSVVAVAQSDRIIIRQKTVVPKHEIRLGIAPFSILEFQSIGSYKTVPGNYNANSSIRTGSLSFMYTYKLYRWLEIGASFTYAGEYTSRYNGWDKIGGDNRSLFSINPTARFSWFNRRSVRLYSSVSLGVGVIVSKNNTDIVKDESTFAIFSGQFSPFGISAGRKVFFFFEPLCIGAQGSLCIIGLGYRFSTKQ